MLLVVGWITGKDSFQVVTVVGRGIALDRKNLIDSALGVLAFNVDQQMDTVCDAGLDRFVRQLDTALQNATGQPGKRLPRGISVDGGKASTMAGVQGLQKVKGFFPAYLPEDGAFGPVPQAGFEQITDGDGGNLRSLLAARLKADKIRFSDMDFGGIFDD